MFCPACGHQNPPEARHCMSCGAQLLAASIPPTMVAPPEPQIVGHRIASLGARFVAAFFDGLLLVAVYFVSGMWMANRFGGATAEGFSMGGPPALILIASNLFFGLLYFWLFEGIFGATLGKAILGIRVRTIAGAPCTLGASLIRNVLRIIDGLFLYLVGLLVCLFSKLRQRIGDRLAGTVVVESGAGAGLRSFAALMLMAAIGASAWGFFVLHQQAPEASTGPSSTTTSVATSTTIAKSVGEPLVLSSGDFRFTYTWREGSKDGPARLPRPYQRGETVYLSYELAGYGATAEGRADLTLEFAPMDPNRLPLYAPRSLAFSQPGTVSGNYWFELHPFVPAGKYQLAVTIRDAVKNIETTLSPEFEVEAAPIAPATSLEARNFQFSTSKDGPPLDPPVFDAGQTVHYSFDLFGPQFEGDRANWHIAFQLLDPGGKVVLDRPDWDSTNQDFPYHPATFFMHYSGYVSLPSDVPRGTFTVRMQINDRIANRSLPLESKFEVR